MNRRFGTPLIAAVVLVVGAPLTAASGPSFWTTATVADFLRGTSDGVFVSQAGVVSPGPRLENVLATAPAQVWALVSGADGTLWAGTGGDGRVIRIRPGQAEETAFDSDETNVFALAVSGTRTYVATGPDGKVYVIEGSNPAREFFDPEEKYIWALAVDASNRLWVGAGNPAVIHRVDPDGTATVVYKPPAAHVVTLAADASGRMLAGTESPGRLYRFSADDRPFVVLDSGLTELRAVVSAPDGVTYAAAVSRGDEASSGETTSVSVTLASAASTAGSSAESSASAGASAPRRSVLFRIDANGAWEDAWATPDLIYDIAIDDEAVLVGTGPEGRLYRVDNRRDVSLLTGVDAKQITRFVTDAAGRLSAFGTANPGRVIRIEGGQQSPATYVSAVRDTRSVATWGLARWEATGSVTVATRTGNTSTPDDSWSPWSETLTRREGQQIASPPARYIQWRAVLTTGQAEPRLSAVTIAYLGQNARPTITSLTVYPPGVIFQRPYVNDETAVAGLDDAAAMARRAPGDPGPTPPAPTRRMFQRGLQTIAWKGADEDQDRLSYDLLYRREGDSVWRELKRGLVEEIFVWDTTTVPDGRYVIRVRASDSPSNTADRVLSGERDSSPIEVDNTPPAIVAELARSGDPRLLVTVRDARSPIQRVEYSLSGGPWQLVYPADGLADSPEERYEVPLAAADDASRLVIRATDLLQNVTSQPAVR